MKLINRIVLNGYQSLRSSLPYASQLLSREWDMSKNHVFAHSTHMLQPIELKPFSSSPVWKCGHFGTLEAKNGPFSPILEPFLWFFKKLVVLGKMGKKWEKWEKFFFLFLPTYSQHIYLTTLKVSARSENFFKCAKTVRFFADTTISILLG